MFIIFSPLSTIKRDLLVKIKEVYFNMVEFLRTSAASIYKKEFLHDSLWIIPVRNLFP